MSLYDILIEEVGLYGRKNILMENILGMLSDLLINTKARVYWL